jgi:hypothetical protein
MIKTTLKVDPSVHAALHRAGDGESIRKMLRKNIAKRARPVLAAVLARTPYRSGLLQASLGITMREGMRGGEIMAGVGVKDNITFMAAGRKMLVTSQRKVAKAAKAAARRGLGAATQRTAFQYIWGIETGYKRSGRLARRSGGAKMLERGLSTEATAYMDGIGQDVLQHITKNTPTPTI